MRIGINLLFLIPGEVGGTETYGVNLVDALSKIDNKNEYIVYLNIESKSLAIPENSYTRKVICPVRAKNRPARYLFEQLILPILLWRHRIDLIHSLGYVGPILAPCKRVVSIPDTNFYDIRENFSWLKKFILTIFSTWAGRYSDRVITISEFSKSQIHKHIDIPLQKITVTHLGPGWLEKPTTLVDWDAVKECYKLPEKYIIAFGGGYKHKNIPRMLEAYCQQIEAHNHVMVVMGRLPEDVTLPPPLPEGCFGPRVHCLGYVPVEHIQPLLSHASLFVLPSLYEGFGLPILEAQHAGVIVASSFAASLPEIGGSGAIYFDPTSVEAIGNALKQALSLDSGRAETLRVAAQTNLSRFSWVGTAKSTIAVYRKVLGRE